MNTFIIHIHIHAVGIVKQGEALKYNYLNIFAKAPDPDALCCVHVKSSERGHTPISTKLFIIKTRQ